MPLSVFSGVQPLFVYVLWWQIYSSLFEGQDRSFARGKSSWQQGTALPLAVLKQDPGRIPTRSPGGSFSC